MSRKLNYPVTSLSQQISNMTLRAIGETKKYGCRHTHKSLYSKHRIRSIVILSIELLLILLRRHLWYVWAVCAWMHMHLMEALAPDSVSEHLVHL